MHSLNIDYVQAFARVVRLGSFSTAAEQLNITQPAVSMRVRQLERRLGVRLIERVGRRATATAAGLKLLEHVGSIDSAISAALEEVAAYASGTVGRVRIGTGATACTYLLPEVLNGLHKRYPGLELIIRTDNTAEIVRALEENSLDVGLLTLPVTARALQVEPICDDEFLLVWPSGAPKPGLDPVHLAERRLLIFEGGNTRLLIDDWFARAGCKVTPKMTLGSIEAIKALVRARLGCAILPALAVRGDVERGLLGAASLKPALSRRLGIVVRHDKPLNRGLRAVIQAMRDSAVRGDVESRAEPGESF